MLFGLKRAQFYICTNYMGKHRNCELNIIISEGTYNINDYIWRKYKIVYNYVAGYSRRRSLCKGKNS